MPTLIYRHPSANLRLTVEFDGRYEASDFGVRPRYRDTVDFGYPTPYNTEHMGPAARPAPAREVGSADDLFRAMHALVDFLLADAERYAERYAAVSGDTADGYCTRADVAEEAHKVEFELGELASFLSDRERFAVLLYDNTTDADYADLSEEDREIWRAFLHVYPFLPNPFVYTA